MLRNSKQASVVGCVGEEESSRRCVRDRSCWEGDNHIWLTGHCKPSTHILSEKGNHEIVSSQEGRDLMI